MNRLQHIYDVVHRISELSPYLKGSEGKLSLPLCYRKAQRSYVVFIVHFVEEPIPDGYAFYDIAADAAGLVTNREAETVFGLPVRETMKKPDEAPSQKAAPDPQLTGGLLEEFDALLRETDFDGSAYETYLERVLLQVKPEERKYFEMFRQERGKA
ncbi:MAG: hypothetical protein IKS07_03985 [Lachnospiraceae bacterium]|nr:hypothetical protein [Lachnospiraceae bacterium]